MSRRKRIVIGLGCVLALIVALVWWMSYPSVAEPERITYGVSFSKFHSDELELDWQETYEALLTDLGVRHFRLSTHWPMVEPRQDEFNFTEIDYQVRRAREVGATVVLSVGRRLPGWPECHDPSWTESLTIEERNEEILELVQAVVERYKDEPHIDYWQVENEAFLIGFAREHCGTLDKDLLQQQIDMVRELDPDTPVLLTDGGEFGLWYPAYARGDAFGTTMYKYIWSPTFGRITYPVTPGFFHFKRNVVQALHGTNKPMILIELGLEPWLTQPIIDTELSVQYEQMGMDKFTKTLAFARDTRFDPQYLWGAEWWYWLKVNHGDERYWEYVRPLFGDRE